MKKYRVVHIKDKFYIAQERKYLLGIFPIYEWTNMYLPCESISFIDNIIPRGKKFKIVESKSK